MLSVLLLKSVIPLQIHSNITNYSGYNLWLYNCMFHLQIKYSYTKKIFLPYFVLQYLHTVFSCIMFNFCILFFLLALYHNNSIYIAHHLMTIGHQFRASLPDPLRESSQVTFLDLVPRMRRIGAECFIKQINRQKIQLIESLSGAQGNVKYLC